MLPRPRLFTVFLCVCLTSVAFQHAGADDPPSRLPPVFANVNEGVQYMLQPPQWVIQSDPKAAKAAGVARSLIVTLSNNTVQHMDVSVEFALYKKDINGYVTEMKMRGAAPPKKNVKSKVLKSISLAPGESQKVVLDGWYGGEMANNLKITDNNVAKKPTVKTEQYYGYSVVVSSGGETVLKRDKNPDGLSDFGIAGK